MSSTTTSQTLTAEPATDLEHSISTSALSCDSSSPTLAPSSDSSTPITSDTPTAEPAADLEHSIPTSAEPVAETATEPASSSATAGASVGGLSAQDTTTATATTIDDVASWDVKKTVEWVGSLFPDDERREKYMTLFRTEEIAASDRAVFTEERLARMIPFGPRTTILAAYSQLTGQGVSPSNKTVETNIRMYKVCHSSREGVALWNPLTSPRTTTCERIDKELDAYGAILFRSPPFSGKTSLAELFRHYLQQRGKRVVLVSFLGLHDPSEFGSFWKKMCNGVSWEDHLKSTTPLTVVLDEVQFMYALGQSSPFWNAIKLAMGQSENRTTKTRVLAFAAFGEKPHDRHRVGGYATTPVAFERLLDLKDMAFSREEFDDLTVRYASTGESARLSIGPEAWEVIWNATWGHPGLVKLCLDKVIETLLPTARVDTRSDHSGLIMEYLLSHDFFVALKRTRATARQSFTEEESRYLRKLLDAGDDGVSPDGFPMELTNSGLIGFHDVKRIRLAAPLFRGILIQRFYSSPRPMYSVRNFNDFIKQGGYPRVRTALADGILPRRHLSAVLRTHNLPDVGAVFGLNGFLDFYVAGGLKWGIELLREGQSRQRTKSCRQVQERRRVPPTAFTRSHDPLCPTRLPSPHQSQGREGIPGALLVHLLPSRL